MYYRGDVKPDRTWDETDTELQPMTRQQGFVTSMLVQAKLNTRALLDQVFPAYTGVFYNLFSITALNVLGRCLAGKTEGLVDTIQEFAGKSPTQRGRRKKRNNENGYESLGKNNGEARHKPQCLGV